MGEPALSGLKVLDLTWHIAGPYCTKLLADYGADVIKVERPGAGDPTRSKGPFPADLPHPEKSGLFLHLNTNKRSVTLDLKSGAGKRIFLDLVKRTHILVESFRPRVMPSLGFSFETLTTLNPRLVMTSVSSFGQDGPYREFKATETIIYGMGGAMYFTGLPEREPLKLGGTVVQYQVGNMAAVATVLALYAAEAQQTAQRVDISAFESQAATIDRRGTDLLAYQYCGLPDRRASAIRRTYPYGTYPCNDGYIELAGGGAVFFPRTARMLGMPELLEDPRFSDPVGLADVNNKEAFESEYFLPWLLQRNRREVWAAAQEANILSGPVFTVDEVLEDPHYRERGYWREIEHPVAGKLRYPGPPFRMGENPWRLARPAPLLGQHNAEVYGELGYDRQDLARLRALGTI